MKTHTVKNRLTVAVEPCFWELLRRPVFWIVFYELCFLFQGQHTEDPHGEEGGQRNLLLRG
jgi:hypothetical protein